VCGLAVECATAVTVGGDREAHQVFAVLLDPDMQLATLGHTQQLATLSAAPF